jgi:hypothetical protein
VKIRVFCVDATTSAFINHHADPAPSSKNKCDRKGANAHQQHVRYHPQHGLSQSARLEAAQKRMMAKKGRHTE